MAFQHKCLSCGTLFSSSSRNRKYCSHPCYWEDLKNKNSQYRELYRRRKNGAYYSCEVCGKSFYRSKKSTRKFCSRNCYLVNHSKDMEWKACLVCRREFYSNKKHLFCSNDCYLVDHAKEFVTFICPECGKEFSQSVKLSNKKIYCSNDCGNKAKGKNSTRNKKISKGLKKVYSSGKRLSWSKGLTKETNSSIAKMSETLRLSYMNGRKVWNDGLPLSKEQREKHSEFISRLYLEGKARYNTGHFYSKKNDKSFFYRSSYELIALNIFEQLSTVVKYEYEPLRIAYKDEEGLNRYTIPDFLVSYKDGSRELIEVKPEYKLDWKREKIKLKTVEKFAAKKNWLFSVWTENELGLNNQ